MKYLGWVFACTLSAVALAAPPAAPVLSVHASNIRELTFDWNLVSGAGRYELWFKANDAAAWVQYSEKHAQTSSLRASVAGHLLHWPQARYQLKACNTDGCRTSNTVRVNGEKLVALGYLKPTVTDAHYFGASIALSADGKTLAVVSAETVGSATTSAVVYVYRNTGTGWHLEARLLPSVVRLGTAQGFIGDQLAISSDGNLIALGAWLESTVAPDPPNEYGAVYLFRRSGTTWRVAQRLTGTSPTSDWFGYVVKLDDAGRTLVVSHYYRGEDYARGTLEIYRDPAGGSDQFVHDVSLPPPVQNGDTSGCEGVALSGDGQTLVRGCYFSATGERVVQILKGPAWSDVGGGLRGGEGSPGFDLSYDGSVLLAQDTFNSLVYEFEPGAVVRAFHLTTFGGNCTTGRRCVALSRDGKFAAVGSTSDVAAGLGAIFPPYQTAEGPSGGVFIHERRSSGWVLRRLVKPGSAYEQLAGHSVALGDNGRVMATGAVFDASAASGINGNRNDSSAPNRGAVWLY